MKYLLSFLLMVGVAWANDDILMQIDKNLQPGSSESYKKLVNIEPDGSKKEFLLYQAKTGSDKMVSMFLKPETEKGRNTLRLGENMWLYMPDVGRPIRITSMQSVVGGVFNNSDIMRLDFSSEYDLVKNEDKGEQILLELKAKNDTVAYDRLVMSVDKKALVPIEVQCYSSTEMLIKTLYYKDIKDFGNGIVRPAVIETVSPFYKDYKSIMVYGKITPKEFSAEAFTLENIGNVENLRR
ncbi:MAG: outer membrane lipoprotein-sorting protein [Campylobacterota bacterium]|nr:outer membrane lipoprotein-sorting protein [Campylobacterota bacterium]